MPRKTNIEPSTTNPRWKTISLPYAAVMPISEYVESHPELGYNGVGDFIISKIRLDEEYKRALAEYAVRHGVAHPDEEQIKEKIREIDALNEQHRAKIKEYEEKKRRLDQIEELLKD